MFKLQAKPIFDTPEKIKDFITWSKDQGIRELTIQEIRVTFDEYVFLEPRDSAIRKLSSDLEKDLDKEFDPHPQEEPEEM